MNFNDYQKQAKTTLTVNKDLTTQIIYLALGLVGESGEIAEKIKKIIRNEDGDFEKLDREDIKRELGDVLWYLAMLADTLELKFDDVAAANLSKLADRKQRGVVNSTGDYR
ncbi:hypothetical protein EOL73_04470 [Candidatus Saccharibacteria bacterium]|nr:hypothetical protein [Candidatus Saccharibacteria bacterium]NCU40979.1 hypothetical protein [Candidatus Saccharibacteria bacterium]